MTVRINTVLGPISPVDLGITLMHEHLVFGYPGWQCDTAAPPYNRERVSETCVGMLREAGNYGLKTMVDATPNDGSRDPDLYKIVSEKSGVNIICATGLYTEAEGSPAYFKKRSLLSGDRCKVINEMSETFIRDITVGIGDSGIKAGVIKVGTGKGAITPYEEMVLEAAVMAQKSTGAPIITHTEAGTMGPGQADFLIGKGVDVKRLMIGHICGNPDVDYHLEVLRKGVFISFDRFGLEGLLPDTLRTSSVADLVGMGYHRQIMLSQDYVIHWLGRGFPMSQKLLPRVANWGLTHIFKNIIPGLKRASISDEQIHTMMVDNPRRLFAGE